MSAHNDYLWHCFRLARLGAGKVAPNPMVGACLVHEGKIIGEGYHERYGGPHAEVQALSSVTNADLLRTSTLYVSLEPCCHFGKTPPCTSLIIEKKVREVVVGCRDPFPKVSGGGISLLSKSGIQVVMGGVENQARWLNRRFISVHERKRPYVILKWAETADGFIAKHDGSSRWISGEASRALVHRWREEESAILVGTNTALRDNPRLTARRSDGSLSASQPHRIVLDRELKIPATHYLLDGETSTLVVTETPPPKSKAGIDYLRTAFDSSLLPALLTALRERGCLSLFVEGGAKTLQTFISAGLWDEARVFTAPHSFGEGILAPRVALNPLFKKAVGEDTLTIMLNPYSNFEFTESLNEF